MIKLILSLPLILAFSSTAGALLCHRCIDVNDPNCDHGFTTLCVDGQVCLNAFVTEPDSSQRIYRNCVNLGVCPPQGSLTIAVNLENAQAISNAKCCDTDNCNTDDLPYFDPQDTNGKFCSACPGMDECDTVVNCTGEQDTCFEVTLLHDGDLVSAAGCGTPGVCAFADSTQSLPFLEQVGTVLPLASCYLFTTTTTTTTTTPNPTTTEPTTTATFVTASASQSNFLLQQLRTLAAKMKVYLIQQHIILLFQVHLQLLDYHQLLLLQQEELPFDSHHQLPLYYQQCLIVNHHQLLLHQIHLSLCGQQQLLQLFQQQQLAVQQLQGVLNNHHSNLLPHYHSYLLHGSHYQYTTTAPPTTTTPTTATSTTPLPL